jgi:hypothetical protein
MPQANPDSRLIQQQVRDAAFPIAFLLPSVSGVQTRHRR